MTRSDLSIERRHARRLRTLRGTGALAALTIGLVAVGPGLRAFSPSGGLTQTPLDTKPSPTASTLLVNAHNAGDQLGWARSAVAAHAGMIEIDVSRIGTQLFASHNPLASLRLASPTSLAASWSIARLSGRVLFDIKSNSSTAVDQLIRFVLHHQGPVNWFSTSDMQALDRLRHGLPGSILLLTVGSGPALARLLSLAPKPGEINGVSIEQHLLTRSVVEELRRRGLLVQAYTIDQMSRINLLAGWGVTGITTNNVTAMAALSVSHGAAAR